MGGLMSNDMLGKMLHREYEADASRYWGWREGGSNAENSVAGFVVDDIERAVAELRDRRDVFEQYDSRS